MAHTAHTSEEAMRERFDSPEELEAKLDKLAALVQASKHFVAFTGAGISTSAGIPDFRGPDGVWTLRAQGRSRTGATTSTIKAFPTKTHMSLVELQRRGILKHLISQNTDGLLRRSGFHPDALSELHGNSNMEECEGCQRRYFRDFSCRRLQMTRDHFTGRHCGVCGGRLLEWTIDFGQTLPEDQLEAAMQNSKLADLHLALGSSLTVSPACDMPRATGKKRGGKLVIVNLQNTPLDSLATIRIYAKTDAVMEGLMRRLAIPIPEWRLNRRVILSVQHTEKGSNLVVQGIDIAQALPATLFTKVEVSDRQHTNATRAATVEPLTVTFAHRRPPAVDVQLFFQGHYNEPPITLPSDMSIEGDVLHALSFDPFAGTWQVGEAQPCPLELLNSVLLKKREEMGVHRRPLSVSVVCDSRFGSWPSASLVPIEGRPVGVVVGGKNHTVSLIDLSSGAVVAPTNLDPDLGCVGQPRWGHTASVVENKVVLIAGWDSSCQYGDVIVYDPATGSAAQLRTSGDSLAPRSCHAAAVNENMVYVFGGAICRNGPYHYYDDLMVLDLRTSTWRSLPRGRGDPWPSARSQHSLTAVGGRLVLVGGCDATKLYDDVWTFDIPTKKWTLVSEHTGPESGIPAVSGLPQTDFRVHALRHTATAIGLRLLLWGKWGMSMLNLESGVWTKLSVPPKCVANAVCSDGRNIWSFGGIDPDSHEGLPVLCLST